ncbi:MAG TPA: response regulator [Planctomycetota bacterium]|nr:response regulator [Planctomycetota bacterium]
MTKETKQQPRKSSAISRGNVLIVEDDKDTAQTLLVILGNAGYGVRKVSSRDAALQVLLSNLYQCILLDFYMPGMPAEEFVAALQTAHPIAKVVLITAASEVETAAKRLGIPHYLGKPFEPEALLNMVEKACKA